MNEDIDYEVCCSSCGEYFELSALDGSLGEIYGECVWCGYVGEHEIVKEEE
jgi:hypothetical protein